MTILIQHHVKYKEIHGYDEIKLMGKGEHLNHHKALRKEGKCKVPKEELKKISCTAFYRTEKYRTWYINHPLTERKKEMFKQYHKKAYKRLDFVETVDVNILLYSSILYNTLTGNITISSRFQGNHGLKLKVVDEMG